MDFETVVKVLVAVAAAVAIPVGAYAAIVATRAIWVKGEPGKFSAAEAAALRERVEELEAQVARLGELEDRLDFTERMLSQARSAGSLREEN
ncbi:MAG TPA: hypothetical protein VFU45_07025 [Gemmatimonadales bacterium]|nr:hypothetical protein [Gemmatimonadales bacterium]